MDGVGFPAVGSICGTSNADVAKRLEAPVLLVVKAGVGAAIDEANYGTAFFGARDVPVLGVVLNRSASQGFYAREKILAPVHAYFAKTRLGLYGVIPDEPALANLRNEAASKDIDTAPVAAHVRKHVDVEQLMSDAARDPWNSRRAPPSSTAMDAIDADDLRLRIQQAAAQLGAEVKERLRRVKSFFPLVRSVTARSFRAWGAGPTNADVSSVACELGRLAPGDPRDATIADGREQRSQSRRRR